MTHLPIRPHRSVALARRNAAQAVADLAVRRLEREEVDRFLVELEQERRLAIPTQRARGD